MTALYRAVSILTNSVTIFRSNIMNGFTYHYWKAHTAQRGMRKSTAKPAFGYKDQQKMHYWSRDSQARSLYHSNYDTFARTRNNVSRFTHSYMRGSSKRVSCKPRQEKMYQSSQTHGLVLQNHDWGRLACVCLVSGKLRLIAFQRTNSVHHEVSTTLRWGVCWLLLHSRFVGLFAQFQVAYVGSCIISFVEDVACCLVFEDSVFLLNAPLRCGYNRWMGRHPTLEPWCLHLLI
jgi:hypothetical protein